MTPEQAEHHIHYLEGQLQLATSLSNGKDTIRLKIITDSMSYLSNGDWKQIKLVYPELFSFITHALKLASP